MTTTSRPPIDLTGLVLYSGAHDKDAPECCFEEASAILDCALRDPHPPRTWGEALARFGATCKTDHPPNDSPLIAGLMRNLNDYMTDSERVHLVPYELKVAGSRGLPAVEERRLFVLLDVAIREWVPALCDALALPEEAAALRALPAIVDIGTARSSDRAVDRDLVRALTLALDRDLSRALDRAVDRDLARDLVRALAPALVRALDRDLDRDLDRALSRALAPALALALALALARGEYIVLQLGLVDRLLAVA